MKALLYLPAVIVIALAMLSCDQKGNSSATGPRYAFMQPPDSFDVGFIPLFASAEKNLFHPEMTDSMMQLLGPTFAEGSEIASEIDDFIQDTINWIETDRQVRIVLQDHQNHPTAYNINQITASSMLWKKLLLGDTTEQRQETVSYYVNLLVESSHPDADLIARALKFLSVNSFWSPSQIAATANQAKGFAEEYLQKENFETCNCVVDPSDQTFDQLMGAKTVKLERVYQAISQLDSLRQL